MRTYLPFSSLSAVRDVKGMSIGAENLRFKAEVHWNGRAISAAHCKTLDLEKIYKVSSSAFPCHLFTHSFSSRVGNRFKREVWGVSNTVWWWDCFVHGEGSGSTWETDQAANSWSSTRRSWSRLKRENITMIHTCRSSATASFARIFHTNFTINIPITISPSCWQQPVKKEPATSLTNKHAGISGNQQQMRQWRAWQLALGRVKCISSSIQVLPASMTSRCDCATLILVVLCVWLSPALGYCNFTLGWAPSCKAAPFISFSRKLTFT